MESKGGDRMSELKFDWRWKDYGLRAIPKRLIRFDDDESNETIDFIKYFRYGNEEKCYSIGYFYYNEHEPCWELKFVGDRFKEIAPEDLSVVWKYLLAAYDVLTEWKNSEKDI